MPFSTFIALFIFAFVTSVTPGPNNLMLFASGVNFGFRRTIPHMLGIGIGFFILLICVGLGLGAIFQKYPKIYLALKIAGGIYLLWIAYHIATTKQIGEAKSSAKPMSFIGAVLFQWINPKAWVMAVTAMVTYADPNNYIMSVFLISSLFAAINLPTVSTWTAFGQAMQKFLSKPRALKAFNISMAILLVLSLYPMLK